MIIELRGLTIEFMIKHSRCILNFFSLMCNIFVLKTYWFILKRLNMDNTLVLELCTIIVKNILIETILKRSIVMVENTTIVVAS